ncbi:MAG: hypothetical protein AAGF98_10925 [Cyanobacteria bacterium P01_H01_bin.153]
MSEEGSGKLGYILAGVAAIVTAVGGIYATYKASQGPETSNSIQQVDSIPTGLLTKDIVVGDVVGNPGDYAVRPEDGEVKHNLEYEVPERARIVDIDYDCTDNCGDLGKFTFNFSAKDKDTVEMLVRVREIGIVRLSVEVKYSP